MNPKFQLIKHTVALWTLLGVTIYYLITFLLAGPDSRIVETILMANAILYGVGMWVWQVRIYMKEAQPKDTSEQEEWGV